MKRTVLLYSLVGGLQLSVFSQSSGIDQFQWLIGSWGGTADEGILSEHWQLKDQECMTGHSYFIMNNDTIVNESIRIEKVGNYWCFIAIVNGKPPVLFSLSEQTKDKWVFENKEHDFPQRVVYTKNGDHILLAWIEGTENGKLSKETFQMKKIE